MALHHYVAQFYLKYFSISGQPDTVYVYRRKKEETQARNVKKVAAVQNFYRVTLVDGEKSEQVEQMFSQLEGNTKQLLDRCLAEKADFEFSNEEYALLALYMAYQYMRGPTFRMRMHNTKVEILAEKLKEISVDKETFRAESEKIGVTFDDDADFETTREMFSDIRKHFKLRPQRREEGLLIRLMMDWANELAQLIFYKRWSLYESKGNGVFVTSDNPITVMQDRQLPIEGVRWFLTGVVSFPISPGRALILEPAKIQRQVTVLDATKKQIHDINHSTMFNAHREIYSNINSRGLKRAFDKTEDGAAETIMTEADRKQMEDERIRRAR